MGGPRSRSVALLVQPVSCWRLLDEGTHIAIDQEIRINSISLKHSRSAVARASEMLFKLAIRSRPSATACAEKCSRRFVDRSGRNSTFTATGGRHWGSAAALKTAVRSRQQNFRARKENFQRIK
jgi:hypothetical protein